jgi:two-component system cell cycle sensor histidine kinase PleC
LASNAGQGWAGVTPERRGPGRLSGSRKRARLLTFVALAGLAGLAIAGAARFGQLAPRSPELIAWFLIACASAALLGIALLAEMRRLERIEAAQAASEHRFRMAVEAARCGIWEWDLSSDQIYMSEVTAALFGWRGGVVPGQQVLDRAAPGHRDDLRDALTNAAIYGGFDVSFRVPPLAGARPVWIDFRGRGFGESPEGGFARIIGVGLDVTEERLAQARAQAAESRLRDAIESTSEAFVLWDRGGRLAMWNSNFRDIFKLDAGLLRSGAARDLIDQAARRGVRQETPAPGHQPGVREAELSDGRWVQISERPTAHQGGGASRRRRQARAQSGPALRTGPQVRGREDPRRAGQRRQDRVPGQYESRAAYAAQRHQRLLRDHGGGNVWAAGRAALSRLRPRHPGLGSAPAGADQRHPRHVQDRGREVQPAL